MRIRVGCEFDYESDAPVPMLMLVRAQPDGEHHTLYESRWTEPDDPVREYVDAFGNHCWRFVAPGRPASHPLRRAGRHRQREPDPVVPDAPLVAGRGPARRDARVHAAQPLHSVGPARRPGLGAVRPDAAHLGSGSRPCATGSTPTSRYETGSSDPTITALDVFERRVGVCRDFALLATALCRALNIPARYTFGYLPDIAVEPPDVPMDFHAWFEAYSAAAGTPSMPATTSRASAAS